MEPDPTGIFRTLFEWAWAIVLALVGILWKKHDGDIDKLKSSSVSKDELERRVSQRDVQYNNLRGDIKELFQRDDQLKDIIHGTAGELRKDIQAAVDKMIAEIRSNK